MVLHVFLFKWKKEATPAQKMRAAEEINAFQGKIPGLLETSYRENTSPHSQGFTHGGVMKFSNPQALRDYFPHPIHQELLEWLMPLLETAAELDYEI